jgi:uncharacterized protein (DUF1697 family)
VTRYVALLRGVNVGGRTKVPMADLRDLVRGLGHDDVSTYVQSGNVMFSATRRSPDKLAAEIEAGIAREFGLSVTVLVRNDAELAAVVGKNPFVAAGVEPNQLYVAFLSAAPEADRWDRIDRQHFAPDEFEPGDRAVYLRYVTGAGRTKLSNDQLERRLDVRATTRNWRTTSALLDLMREREAR